MFHEIDENTWDRKEIYDAFYGYTYAMTVQLDMTELYAQMKEHGYKFYPTICWLITKTVIQMWTTGKSPWYNRIL